MSPPSLKETEAVLSEKELTSNFSHDNTSLTHCSRVVTCEFHREHQQFSTPLHNEMLSSSCCWLTILSAILIIGYGRSHHTKTNCVDEYLHQINVCSGKVTSIFFLVSWGGV
jgi:hypothetical protein